jgi:tetratricopeptide (TPR) repeat protein
VQLKVRVRAIHKELLLLILLSVATVPLFLFTRMMAGMNRRMHIRMAEVSYKEGQEKLQSGDVKPAVEFFRWAATNDHNNPLYRLALARALASQGNIQEARRTLLLLRESAPENAEINLDLARLEAREGSVAEALRYYRNSVSGIWPQQEMDRRRREVRAELIGFLLGHRENRAALSEALVFSGEIPDTLADHIKAGQFLLAAGDAARASDQFTRALRSDGDDVDALTGAGEAAFVLARYDTAARYLQAAVTNGAHSERAENLLRLARLVRSEDVLAASTSLEERRQRFIRNFARARERLRTCSAALEASQDGQAAALATLNAEASAFERQMTRTRIRRNPEILRTGLSLIYRIETAANRICGKPERLDEALILIARIHGVAEDEQPER